MISNKTKYGLKAAFYLAKHSQEGQVLISELAKKEKIPQKFLEAILLELKKKGILNSKKGKGGGYSLARPADEIMVGEIVRVLEGLLTPAFKISNERSEIDIIIRELSDAMSNVLDKTSLNDVVERVHSGKEVFNFMI